MDEDVAEDEVENAVSKEETRATTGTTWYLAINHSSSNNAVEFNRDGNQRKAVEPNMDGNQQGRTTPSTTLITATTKRCASVAG